MRLHNILELIMNENIKHLATICWDKQLDGKLHFDQEKFAEEIIFKCIELMDENYRGDMYTGDVFASEYNNCINEQVQALEDYFGVNK